MRVPLSLLVTLLAERNKLYLDNSHGPRHTLSLCDIRISKPTLLNRKETSMVHARRVGRSIENMRTFSSLEQHNGKRHCNIVPAKAQERGVGQTFFFWFGFVVCIVVCFGIKSLEKNQYVQYELYNIIIIAASSRFASITSFKLIALWNQRLIFIL